MTPSLTLPRRAVPLAVLLVMSACVGTPRGASTPLPAAAAPRFDAIAFFTGRTHGEGRLRKVMAATQDVRVDGQGTIEDGVLHLDQQVHEGDKPVRTRHWLIRADRPGHYLGTLSDVPGAVTGTTHGNRLHLHFRLKGGFPTDQWLTLSPDGQHARNVLTVHKFGMPVAVLVEDIVRQD